MANVEIEIQASQDVPVLESGLTSSVGALWPPERASFNRIKGIYTPGVIDTPQQLQQFLGVLRHQVEIYFNRVDSNATRISLRTVVSVDTLQEYCQQLQPYIEALIPLAGTQPTFENSALVYFGVNDKSRQPLTEELDRYRQTLTEIERRAFSPQEILARTTKNGFQILTLPVLGSLPADQSEKTVDQVSQLYKRFGWEHDDVKEILSNQTNIISVASLDGRIVSAGIAEMVRIPIGKESIRIVEITEAATHQDYAGMGLYTAVSTRLLCEICRLSQGNKLLGGEVDIVFGECNGNAPGVLKTAIRQQRTFSVDIGEKYGFPNSGILPQHVPISGAPRKTPYNDLFPTFIPREKLYKNYGGD